MSRSPAFKISLAGFAALLIRLIAVVAMGWASQVDANEFIATEVSVSTGTTLLRPRAVAFGPSGNLYIADTDHHVILTAATGGYLSVAGTGTAGFSGDGGAAASATLRNPASVFADPSGNLYIADTGNHRIRKVSPSGTITTVAGNGTAGFSGDGGAATAAQLSSPAWVVADAAGNLLISDNGNHRIRKVTPGGAMSTVAGNGTAGFGGDGGAATAANLNAPSSIAITAAGDLYIADAGNHRVRKVATGGTIITVAGTGTAGSAGDGGSATAAQLNGPRGVALDAAGNVYISELNSHRIRRIDSAGVINTLAGNGTAGYSGDGGDATSATINNPRGLAFDALGRLYVADTLNSAIRKISTGGIGTVVGNGSTGASVDGVFAPFATLNQPRGVCVADYLDAPATYVADTVNNRILKVDRLTGKVTTALGGGQSNSGSGLATEARLSSPRAVAFDVVNNSLYVADSGNHRVLSVTGPSFSTVAGTGIAGFGGDGGAATSAALNLPVGLALIHPPSSPSSLKLYIADSNNHRIRMVNVFGDGSIRTVAGNGTAAYSGDGAQAVAATLNGPSQVTLDGNGNLYISDTSNSRIRKVDLGGTITTVVGNGTAGFSGDGGAATSAMIFSPSGLVHDGAAGATSGNLYFSDRANNRVRVVDTSGVIKTLVGVGTAGYGGDGAPASQAQLNAPYGIALGIGGIADSPHLYIADSGNNRIREAGGVRPQAISFQSPGNHAIGDGYVPLIAVADSGLGVSFTALTPLTCSVFANTAVLVLAPGTCSIAADQTGGGQWAPASQVVRSFTIAPLKTQSQVQLTSSPNPSLPGQVVTITSTVTGSAPTGSVQFKNGGVNLDAAVTLSGGSAVLVSNSLAVGNHSITAAYDGDAGNTASVSPAITQVVNQAVSSVALSVSPPNPSVGQTVTLTATVTGYSPTGSVQFMDGTFNLGASVLINGTAAISTSVLSVGSHSLTAVYVGDVNNTARTSDVAAVTVTAGSGDVPTLPEWGLILLGMTLLMQGRRSMAR